MTDKEAMKLALEALEKALRYHGVMLLSDPPQDAWKYHRVEQTAHEAITALKERLAQPEPIQSLQCFHCQVTIETLNDKVMHLLAQRTWVGLTDEERNDCLVSADPCEALAEPEARQLIEDVEQALKEKNA